MKDFGAILYSDESQSNVKELLRYKRYITPRKRDAGAVEDFLLNELSAIKRPFSVLRKSFQECIKYNISCARGREASQRAKPAVYEILRNERTLDYYNDRYKRNFPLSDEGENIVTGEILAVIDPETEYISCGSERLFLEMRLMLGVTREDYEGNTVNLLWYLSNYREYQNRYNLADISPFL